MRKLKLQEARSLVSVPQLIRNRAGISVTVGLTPASSLLAAPWNLSLSSRQVVGLSKDWKSDLFICVVFLPHFLFSEVRGGSFVSGVLAPRPLKKHQSLAGHLFFFAT